LNTVRAARDNIVGVRPEARVLGKVSGVKGFKAAVHPSACVLEIDFGGDEENSTFGFSGLNVMAPGSVENNLSECHAAVWVGRVSDVDGCVEVVVSYADDRNGCNVIKILVVVADEVAIRFNSNDGNDTAKRKLNVR